MHAMLFIHVPGFIDFIVDPTFSLLTDMAEKIVIPLVQEHPDPPDPSKRHRCYEMGGVLINH